MNELSLLRVLQLASPGLPVGAYAYSQGLESAVSRGWVRDEASLADWLNDQLEASLGRLDLPLLIRLHTAASAGDDAELRRWSRILVAHRESRELVADDCERGRALARLLRDLGVAAADPWVQREDAPLATLHALAAVAWKVPSDAALHAYAWAWLEGQVFAGVKLVPLGQVAGQRLLHGFAHPVVRVCADAWTVNDDDIGGTLPIMAIASCLHETEYTRLFRS